MKDAYFFVPAHKVKRVASVCSYEPGGLKRLRHRHAEVPGARGRPLRWYARHSAGSGNNSIGSFVIGGAYRTYGWVDPAKRRWLRRKSSAEGRGRKELFGTYRRLKMRRARLVSPDEEVASISRVSVDPSLETVRVQVPWKLDPMNSDVDQ